MLGQITNKYFTDSSPISDITWGNLADITNNIQENLYSKTLNTAIKRSGIEQIRQPQTVISRIDKKMLSFMTKQHRDPRFQWINSFNSEWRWSWLWSHNHQQ